VYQNHLLVEYTKSNCIDFQNVYQNFMFEMGVICVWCEHMPFKSFRKIESNRKTFNIVLTFYLHEVNSKHITAEVVHMYLLVYPKHC